MTTTPPPSAGDGLHAPVPASAAVNAAAPRRTWSRKRRNATIVIGAVVAIAMVTGGAFGLTALGAKADQRTAVDASRTALKTLAKAETANGTARRRPPWMRRFPRRSSSASTSSASSPPPPPTSTSPRPPPSSRPAPLSTRWSST